MVFEVVDDPSLPTDTEAQTTLALGAAFEQRGVGMVFEVVDDPSLPTDTEAQTTRAILASAAFVFGLPLLAIAVGAFSPSRDRT